MYTYRNISTYKRISTYIDVNSDISFDKFEFYSNQIYKKIRII